MKLDNEAQLREIYGHPKDRARNKVLGAVDKHARHFISKAPFLVLSTIGKAGRLDASPRGGQPGFVRISDSGEVVVPDFKGNNRLDSLVNIVETGRAGLIFMIPGINETLRINGRASISTSPDLFRLFSEEPKPPITCIVIQVEELFLHCAKALMRSRLWEASIQLNPESFPTMGQMLKDHLNSPEAPESRGDMLKRYQQDL